VADQQILERWVANGEGPAQEFKTRTSAGLVRAAGETVSGFLNTGGGRVLFGVTDDGRIVGQEVTDKTLRAISSELQQHLDPPAFPGIEVIRLGGDRAVVVVETDRGTRRPYSFRGKAYTRVGPTTLELSRDQYNELLLEAVHASSRWESQTAHGWVVGDLDEDQIIRAVSDAIRRGRLSDPLTRDPAELLRGLGLIGSEGLLRAAVVLFARADRVLPDYPQCRVRLARFKGTDKGEFIDNRQYEGNAFELIVAANQFLRQHLPVSGRVVPNLFERQDDPIYPPEALREALANAFCHRDYATGGGSVGIAIFDDRLEITSPGGLHFGLTVDDLYRAHESRPWNPAIASVFYKCGIIESWGRGTLKMAELTERAGLPRPEFEEMAGTLLVRFLPTRYVPPQRIGHDLTSAQRQILAVLADGGATSLADIYLGIGGAQTRRSIQSDLQLLRSWDLVDSSGWGRGARWFLRDAPKTTS
jgi:ATP-dependent DNA helicase RecG